MKRFTVLLICIMLAAFAITPQSVYAAEARYARAATRTAYFFTDRNTTSSIFAVPYTYCVEVIRDEGDWYYVRYANDTGIYKALYGYCRRDDFTLESGTPDVTYLYKTVTVNYSANNNNSTLPVLSQIAVEAAYYGTYYSGATVYSYVYCQGSFGYIEGANDDYPLNLPEEKPADEDGNNGGSGQKPGSFNVGAIVAIVILAVLVAVILIIYFATRKPRKEG
ncbi:MAG: hypothetical protein K2O44_01065 [Clostridia bacterium]|nr:hypothetical protein [Clostridia bacterium]